MTGERAPRWRNGVPVDETLIERALATCRPLTPAQKAALLLIFTAPSGEPGDVNPESPTGKGDSRRRGDAA